jgi:endonuclease IV
MGAEAIIQILAWALPLAEKAGVDAIHIFQGIQAGKTVEELIAEAEAARDDLKELPFA